MNKIILSIDEIKNRQVLLKTLTPKEISRIEIYAFGYNCKSVFSYNLLNNKVKEEEIPNYKFSSFHSFCNYKGKAFLSGGKLGSKELNTFYQIERNEENKMAVKELPNMIYSRSLHSMIASDNFVFSISGTRNKTVEKFDIMKNQWIELPPLNSSRERCSSAIYNDSMYVFFGLDKFTNKYPCNFEKHKFDTDNWILIYLNTNINLLKRQSVGVVPCQDNKKIFFVGGLNQYKNESKDIFHFNFKNNSFTQCKFNTPSNCSFVNNNFISFFNDNYFCNITENFDYESFDNAKEIFLK